MKGSKLEVGSFHENVLMDEMMQVVGVDLLSVVDVDGGQSYVRARANCIGCACKAMCRDWLAEHGVDEPQSFCPNAGLFRALKDPVS
jgi:Family of unknown function (DUF6455)